MAHPVTLQPLISPHPTPPHPCPPYPTQPEYGGFSTGTLQDDDGPWRNPQLLAAAGLLPHPHPSAPRPSNTGQRQHPFPAQHALPPVTSVLLRMAAALAREPEVSLQPSVMVAAVPAAPGADLCVWHSLPQAPSLRDCERALVKPGQTAATAATAVATRRPRASRARRSGGGCSQSGGIAAAATEAPVAPQEPQAPAVPAATKPVRPSPFACPQQHMVALSAIHGGSNAAVTATRQRSAPAATSAAPAPAPAAAPAATPAAAAAAPAQASQGKGRWVGMMDSFPPELPAIRVPKMPHLPSIFDCRPPYLARLRIGRSQGTAGEPPPSDCHTAAAASVYSDGGALQFGLDEELASAAHSFKSCLSKLPSGQLSGRWSGLGSFQSSSFPGDLHVGGQPRRSAADAWQEGVNALEEALASCYLTPHGSFAPGPLLQLRLSGGWGTGAPRRRGGASRGQGEGGDGAGRGGWHDEDGDRHIFSPRPYRAEARQVLAQQQPQQQAQHEAQQQSKSAEMHMAEVEVRLPAAATGKAAAGIPEPSAFSKVEQEAAQCLTSVDADEQPSSFLCGLGIPRVRRAQKKLPEASKETASKETARKLSLSRCCTFSAASSRIGAAGSAGSWDCGGGSSLGGVDGMSSGSSSGASAASAPSRVEASTASQVEASAASFGPGGMVRRISSKGARVARWWLSRISSHGSSGSSSAPSPQARGAAQAAAPVVSN